MKKGIEHVYNYLYIRDFDYQQDMDEEGYFLTEEAYEWWSELADAYCTIEEFETSLKEFSYDGSYEDYLRQQKKADFRIEYFTDFSQHCFEDFELVKELARKIVDHGDFLASDGRYGERFSELFDGMEEAYKKYFE